MNPASLVSRTLRRVVGEKRVLVVGGPAISPIDSMRVLTNQSTGDVAIRLANAFANAGVHVDAWIADSACSRLARHPGVQWSGFSTNDDVLRRFRTLANEGAPVAAIYLAAALSDFQVDRVETAGGDVATGGKISSRDGDVRIVLKPAQKVLPQLRELFPEAYLCGWKFEAGDVDAAREAARQQMLSCRTDACVLNGPAISDGFEWHRVDGGITTVADRGELATALSDAFLAGECLRSAGPE